MPPVENDFTVNLGNIEAAAAASRGDTAGPAEKPAPSSHAGWGIFLCCCILAFVAKVYCAATTQGTNDTGLFELYGQAVAEEGIERTYAASQHFNHTPLLANVLAGMHWVSQEGGLPFPLLLRLPGIVADLVVCLMLWIGA